MNKILFLILVANVFGLVVPNTSFAGGFERLQNRWTGGYMHNEGRQRYVELTGTLKPDGMLGAQWELVPVAGKYFRIKNRLTGEYMHNEDKREYVQLTTTLKPGGMWSAQWELVPVGGKYFRIRNRWTREYMDNENKKGIVELTSTLKPGGMWSAQWQAVPVSAETAAATQPIPPAKDCAAPVVPAGTRLFPSYASGGKNYVKLKPAERAAYLMLLSIRKLEQRCDHDLNRVCSLAELTHGVQGSKTAFNGPMIGLTADPACDSRYSYTLKKVFGGWRLMIVPRGAGVGGFLDDEGAPPGTGIYYNANGPATKHSRKLNGNGWGVGPHMQGGDFERMKSD